MRKEEVEARIAALETQFAAAQALDERRVVWPTAAVPKFIVNVVHDEHAEAPFRTEHQPEQAWEISGRGAASLNAEAYEAMVRLRVSTLAYRWNRLEGQRTRGDDIAGWAASLLNKHGLGEGAAPGRVERLSLDLEYLLRRLLTVFPRRQAEIWFESYNPLLDSRPVDVLAIRGPADVIRAIELEEQGAY